MSKKLSEKDLLKLRSGQTVWRVWGFAYEDGSFGVSATRHVVLGKKVLHWFSAGFSSMRMVCKRPEISFLDEQAWRNREHRVSFLSDVQGLGCFRSARAAARFAEEVNNGLHPAITEYLFRNLEDDELLNSYDDTMSYFEDEDYAEESVA